jgi:hypothetical protein
LLFLFLNAIIALQRARESARDREDTTPVQDLAVLPPGEYLKPALLGYEHLAADVLWLRIVQVLGQRTLSAQEYEWVYQALDVVTTLDPSYAYAYQVGGVILAELGHRPDLSTALLEKGLRANPTVWQIPFYLGYNHFFHFHDDRRAADYMALAAKLPGRPAYLPRLVARLYAEAGSVQVALDWLLPLWRDAEDVHIKDALDTRIKELTITRDLQRLEGAVARYREKYGAPPRQLHDLVRDGFLSSIPPEPFGGTYILDPHTGDVASSARPRGIRMNVVPLHPPTPGTPGRALSLVHPPTPGNSLTPSFIHPPPANISPTSSLPLDMPSSQARAGRDQLCSRGPTIRHAAVRAIVPESHVSSRQQSSHVS